MLGLAPRRDREAEGEDAEPPGEHRDHGDHLPRGRERGGEALGEAHVGQQRHHLEDRGAERRAFGQLLSEKESVQGLLGEAAMGIEIGRLLTMRAALRLEQGGMARAEVSMAKIQVADALHRAVDTAIQLLGARGYSKDTPLEWMYRYARQARLVDGASEVHRMVLTNFLRRQGKDFFAWGAGHG